MTAAPAAARAQFSIERHYAASAEDAWDLWTTKPGIESWWGPEGFEVSVTALDVRPGGHLDYLMTAVASDQVAFMQRSGMPLSTPCRVTFTEVVRARRLAFETLTDFVPGIEPYYVTTLVELEPCAVGVRLLITFDAMHDQLWTDRARAGHESQLRKLDALMAAEGDEATS